MSLKKVNQKPRPSKVRIFMVSCTFLDLGFSTLYSFSAVLTTISSLSEKHQINVGKEAAMEAEARAARERAVVPLETRIRYFLDMLYEKEVCITV